jgi:hypothetical protein
LGIADTPETLGRSADSSPIILEISHASKSSSEVVVVQTLAVWVSTNQYFVDISLKRFRSIVGTTGSPAFP